MIISNLLLEFVMNLPFDVDIVLNDRLMRNLSVCVCVCVFLLNTSSWQESMSEQLMQRKQNRK